MTKTFDICAKKIQQLILGVLCIGSCGLNRNRQDIVSHWWRRLMVNQSQNIGCLGVTVGNTIKAGNVSAVILNIHVHCVKRITKWWAVTIFFPPKENLLLPILPLPTPVKVNRLEYLLEGYDFRKRSFLIEGFKYGFHHFSVGQSRSYECHNLLSAKWQPQEVDQKLAKELEARWSLFPVFRVSPLGTVPKKTPGDFRIIHHLSHPKGKSVNDGISPEHSSVQYVNIVHAIKRIKQSSVGSHLQKQISKVHSGFCQLILKIIIFWVWNGMVNIIMIRACQWLCQFMQNIWGF